MCKYCDRTGPPYPVFLFEKEYDLRGKAEITGDIVRNRFDNTTCLEVTVDFGTHSSWLGIQEIHYCPMCGRKLGGD